MERMEPVLRFKHDYHLSGFICNRGIPAPDLAKSDLKTNNHVIRILYPELWFR